MPAKSVDQYGMAVAVLGGQSSRMPFNVAEKIVRSTPKAQRAKYAKELAKRRANQNPFPEAILQGAGIATGIALATPVIEDGKRLYREMGKGVKGQLGTRNPGFGMRKGNPTSKHTGYFHRQVLTDKRAPILPLTDPWTSDKTEARRQAQREADEMGYPVTVWWASIFDGDLSKQFTVKPRKQNPGSLSQAAELSETFHGRQALDELEFNETEQYDSNLAEIGDLRELQLQSRDNKGNVRICFTRPWPKVASSADGQQLYIVGGDQGLGSQDFAYLKKADQYYNHVGEERTKRMIPLGTLNGIVYFTDKHHLAGPKYQKQGTQYEHTFGEDSGVKPVLIYDTLNKRMLITGGGYRVEDAGIVD